MTRSTIQSTFTAGRGLPSEHHECPWRITSGPKNTQFNQTTKQKQPTLLWQLTLSMLTMKPICIGILVQTLFLSVPSPMTDLLGMESGNWSLFNGRGRIYKMGKFGVWLCFLCNPPPTPPPPKWENSGSGCVFFANPPPHYPPPPTIKMFMPP